MKKTALYVMTAFLSLVFIPGSVEAAASAPAPAEKAIVEIRDIRDVPGKPGEITPGDLKNIDESMKRDMEKALAEQQAHTGGVVVISGTALLIIIILLIILL